MLTVVPEEFNGRDDHAPAGGAGASVSLIDEIVRDGARRMLAEALPLLYLHGLSTGDFGPALGQFLSSSAGRDLSSVDYVYLWFDGIRETAWVPVLRWFGC